MQVGSYPWPWPLIRRVLSPVRPQPGLFRADALACLRGHEPGLTVEGREHIPGQGPVLLVVNHFHRPGFWAWWLSIGLSALVPADVHWVITAELTYPDLPRAWSISPLSRWTLARAARHYGFTIMPAMPPRPGQEAQRAAAVRQVLAYARNTPRPVVGLAPEGGDSSDGSLRWPPAGVGRFMLHLAAMGLEIVPVAAFEAAGQLCFRFGPTFRLPQAITAGSQAQDRGAAEQVMRAIAALLPARLRGDFAS